MSSFKERYLHAKERVNPEGLAVSSAIAGITIPAVVPLEASLTALSHDLANADGSLGRLALIGLVGAINAGSIALEARALKKNEYSASLTGSVLNVATGKAETSAILDHAILTLGPAVPGVAISVYNRDSQLFFDSLVAASLTTPILNIPFNSAIVTGKIDPIVNILRNKRESLVNRLKSSKESLISKIKTKKSNKEIEIDMPLELSKEEDLTLGKEVILSPVNNSDFNLLDK